MDLEMQAREEDLPGRWIRWGQVPRTRSLVGEGVHFFADDYKWSALAKRPERLVSLGPKVAVELNFSTFDGLSESRALADIRRKRSASALWQSAGIRILVDLNVDPAFRHLTLLGVPPGWRAYATRFHADSTTADLGGQHAMAAGHAGSGVLFVVFGGGPAIRCYCRERGWRWSPARGPWRKAFKKSLGVSDGVGQVGGECGGQGQGGEPVGQGVRQG